MDSIIFIIGVITTATIGFVSFLIGVHVETMINKKKADIKLAEVVFSGVPIIPDDKKDNQKKETDKKQDNTPDLGAVERPTPEDLKKKENPRLQEEEDAWGDIEQIMHDSAAAVYRHPNLNLSY